MGTPACSAALPCLTTSTIASSTPEPDGPTADTHFHVMPSGPGERKTYGGRSAGSTKTRTSSGAGFAGGSAESTSAAARAICSSAVRDAAGGAAAAGGRDTAPDTAALAGIGVDAGCSDCRRSLPIVCISPTPLVRMCSCSARAASAPFRSAVFAVTVLCTVPPPTKRSVSGRPAFLMSASVGG